MKISRKEKSQLILEGLVTLGLIGLLYYAAFIILSRMVLAFPGIIRSLWIFGDAIISVHSNQAVSITPFFGLILFVIATIAIHWRLKRRYRQMQLHHIISELHYIAEGHYEHRIATDFSSDMKKVVESIHVLVDSTVQAMEEERRIEQSKDELITNVSHDIRTPLTSIIGYLGLIEQGSYKDQEELLKYTQTAYNKAQQMKILVEDLFEYTRVRQTTTPLTLSEFDMVQLLEQLAADFEFESKKKNMQIEVTSKQDVIMMEADTEKVVRVFNNLVSNALNYGDDGLQISIEVEKIESEVIISVNNDGNPIPPQSLNQLFERFYRVEESRSQETGGTGLGLAIAQSIVELHGGYIYAKSDEKLTQFIVHFPLHPAQNNEKIVSRESNSKNRFKNKCELMNDEK
ncbi:His Kinase A (phospho-acceptor) domain-containing protein [Carnobacterium iners]|uniref:histidine kinase n=1 Tax=Carnobacterium iners TaxID=1073423 RepID=A0A1X7MTP2_9LACT|nr:ATP-binding protein [Carnobacterium iners]SEK73025.1 His Kinase A (phospho-acceptor) domain-containing protein [Carnobacterium iners]SMH27507.1 His Kinase A (phospho-acceptor) domain-containing protein [Carnobacterium iners]